MANVSGKWGQVIAGGTTLADANNWTGSETADVDSFGTFGGGGFKKSVAGQKIFTGTVSGKEDFSAKISAAIEAGEAITLVLKETTAAGPAAADSLWTFPIVVIGNLDPTVDGDGSPAVGWSFSFTSSGSYTRPNA